MVREYARMFVGPNIRELKFSDRLGIYISYSPLLNTLIYLTRAPSHPTLMLCEIYCEFLIDLHT